MPTILKKQWRVNKKPLQRYKKPKELTKRLLTAYSLFSPLFFLKVENKEIVERYMLFPDFDEGRLSTVKNRKHFFSQETKINDALIAIHDEFYNRLLNTLKIINAKY